MLFRNEEILVEAEYLKYFIGKQNVLERVLKLILQIISSSKSKSGEHHKYSVQLLAGINLKGFISANDRLKKGYFSDCEAIFKKNIESLLAQAYLFEHPDEAKKWCLNQIKIGDIEEGSRLEMAKKLDKINQEKDIFPTDMENFFEKFFYEVGYRNANHVAHLDFEIVHREMGLKVEDPTKFATTLILGPNFDKKLVETTLNRLIMFSMFQATLLKKMLKHRPYKEYRSTFIEVKRLFK